MKVGIQGQAGSYHDIVAKKYFYKEVDIKYIDTFRELFDALESNELDQAVVAIANNRYGFIPESFVEFMGRVDGYTVVGEAYLPVKHHLLGVPGTRVEDIKEVHSQAPALGQCREYLEANLPHAALIEQEDTAQSAQLVAKAADKTKAAIASEVAGELNGLVKIASEVQDDANNLTRFLILSGQKAAEHGDKTTMLLKTRQTPGSLADALLPFKDNGINISTLHSSFLSNTNFDMQFMLEFEAGMGEERAKKVLEQLTSLGCQINILGSYKKANI